MVNRLYNKPKTDTLNENLSLLRIVINSKFTRLDFGYQATDYYFRGGWITMDPKAFIRIKDTQEELYLLKAENIPIEPVKHNFNSSAESAIFSLFFPALPNKSLFFDFIEKEPNSPTLFNIYNIEIDTKKAILIKNKQ